MITQRFFRFQHDLFANGHLAGFHQFVQLKAFASGLLRYFVNGAEEGVDGFRLVQRMLLGRLQALLDIAAPLHCFLCISEVLVGLQVSVDRRKHGQRMCLELFKVACRDHADYGKAQCVELLGNMAAGSYRSTSSRNSLFFFQYQISVLLEHLHLRGAERPAFGVVDVHDE
ncbi:hypothetical protein [Pseudomonas syringae]|uniref:hypothetical protein n=1 Tax=Pseudomonas syringae TaxID=317 RepID=UPI0020B36CEA|nr:hypothetical protein [Pseudomonas syringae]